jgi:glycerophosphoryl diester phosphodiesterase
MQQVEVIAHRGASAYAPENTLAAFEMALAMHADAIETDVRMTSDHVLVLCHDARIDRVSDGMGEVASLSLAELTALDFGFWKGEQYRSQRIVVAGRFLEVYGRRCPLVLEIKGDGVWQPLAALVRGAGIMDGVVFTSFELTWLEALRRAEPQAHIGYLTRQLDAEMIRRICKLGFGQICPAAAGLDRATVALAHESGLVVRAWGIDSDDDQNHALQCGVDGMTTNWPDRLLARLVELGWRHSA